MILCLYTLFPVEKRSWVMSAGRMSPMALGRHASPNWSPSNSIDRHPPSLQRMQAVDLPSASEFTNQGNARVFPGLIGQLMQSEGFSLSQLSNPGKARCFP